MTKRRALLLDFGGVITRTLFECLEEIEGHFALPRGSLAWHGPLDAGRDALWRAMRDGQIAERDYWRERLAALAEAIGCPVAMADLIAAMCGAEPNRAIRPEAVATLRKVKAAGCRIGVLSNDLERLYGKDVVSRIDILREADGVVDGSWSRVHKPSPEAYARGLAALGSAAEATVFVDDQPRNVEGASAVGMAGLVFDIRDPARSFRLVEDLLGL